MEPDKERQPMKTIVEILSELEMVGFIKSNGTQCRFVSLVCETVPKLKKNCPFKGVRKVARKLGIINANYNTSVRRRLAETLGVELSEVEYVNGEVWYKHLQTVDGKPLPLVINKAKDNGKHYLQYFPHKSTHRYVCANGEEVTESQLDPYFYAQAERPDFKPCVISIDVANIKKLVASGVIMQTEDLEEAEKILAP
jgi:hypothetical protein